MPASKKEDIFKDFVEYMNTIHGLIPENIYIDLAVHMSTIKERVFKEDK